MIQAVTVTTVASEIVAANAYRAFLVIQNVSDTDVFLKFDASGTEVTAANGFKLEPGDVFTVTSERGSFINPVRAIHAGAGDKELRIQESNIAR